MIDPRAYRVHECYVRPMDVIPVVTRLTPRR